ncbi:glycosyltransferase [Flavobacteriales bacterium]|nr:glycosyltransferase [Flavobacteriales bacterium]
MFKIIHVIPNLKKGGAERLILDICNESNNLQNIKVKLVTFSEENEYQFLTNNIDWEIIPSYFIPSVTKKGSIDIDLLQKKISEFQPNIIHTHLFEAEMVLSQINIGNAKRFSHFHDNIVQLENLFRSKNSVKKKITDFYERFILTKNIKPSINNFICISNDTHVYAKSVLPRKIHKNIHLLTNAIDVSRFSNSQMRIIKQKIKLINIGSFVEKKNQIFLIDVANELRSKGVNFEIVFLGDGELFMDVKSYARKLNVHKQIVFKGKVEKVEEDLCDSDFYVHSATYEPLGLVLIEAMASGLPVITLDGKGNRDLIEEGKNGYMIYLQDPIKFAEKIIELSKHKKKYTEISNYCKEYAKQYDIKEYVNKLLLLYGL